MATDAFAENGDYDEPNFSDPEDYIDDVSDEGNTKLYAPDVCRHKGQRLLLIANTWRRRAFV